MDGSEISVVVLGYKGVGKSAFIQECQRASEDSEGRKRIEICGNKVAVKFVEDPERQRLVHALATIVLFDITNEASFAELKSLLDMAQHIAPAAFPAVLGAKADLNGQRKVDISDVLAFCKTRPCPVPYYEVSKCIDGSCVMALREILARPLINEHVLKATTDQELTAFVHKTMRWAISCNSGNILTHLRGLGYTVPMELIQECSEEMRDYYFGEYPLRLVPKFFHPTLPDIPAPSDDEDELCERDQPMTMVDPRPVLEVSALYCMMWRDISLSCFLPSFLDSASHYPIDQIVHINLSHNCLTSVPPALFQLHNLESLDISHNDIGVLPGVEMWGHRIKLEVLIASYNSLRGDRQLSQTSLPRQQGGNALMFRSLWFLDLSRNNLSSFPYWIFCFPELSHIDLRYNEQITHLPVELSQLQKLDSVLLEGLPLLDPPITIVQQGLKSLKKYLHLKATQGSSPWHTLPVIVVGPEGSGKTTLLAKLRGEDVAGIEPTCTKGLQITELRSKSNLLTRSRSCTVDLWDFPGDPKFRSIYSCFPCHKYLHLLVLRQGTPHPEVAHWLSEIHAMSSASRAKVPVVVVFTHMDRLKGSRSDEYKSEMERYLDVKASSIQTSRLDEATLSMSMPPPIQPVPVATLHGDHPREQGALLDRGREQQQEERDTFLLSALSNVVELFFVSGTTGDAVASVKKYLCNLGKAAMKTSQSNLAPSLQLIGREVPQAYFKMEQLVRDIRLRYRARGEGIGTKVKPFFTFWEAKRLLQAQLNDANITDSDFKCALKFLHEAGVVYTYECLDGSMIVALDPELVGQLLYQTVSTVYGRDKGSAPIRLLSNHSLCQLWGVATIPLPQHDMEVSSQQLLEFLTSVDICAPLHSGVAIFPIVAHQFPSKQLELNVNLVSRRVYLFSYLPLLFFHHLTSRVVLSLNGPMSALCSTTPTADPPSAEILRLSNNFSLQMWVNVLFLKNSDGSAMMICVSRGKEVGPEALTCYGRVDVKLCASLSSLEEARLLGLVTSVIDNLLESKYPVIYKGPQTLEVCVPILSDPTNSSLSSEDASKPGGIPIIVLPQKAPTPATSPNTNALPVVGSYLSSTTNEGSWEVLSRRSSFTAKFTVYQDDANSTHSLVPVWECIQEAMRTPVTRFCSRRITFQEVIPDLLYADLPKQYIYRGTQSGNLCLPDMEEQDVVSSDVSGLRLKKYYTMAEDDVYMHRSADAQRMFCLKEFLAGPRNDFKKLLELKCPYLVSPVGINFSPLVLALEAPPHGTLRSMIRNDPKSLVNDFVHCISLQVLGALQYLHDHGLHYHSLTSENIFIWSLDPSSIKLGEAGIVHRAADCMLCSYLNMIEDKTLRKSVGNQIDFILLGCLEYEMATGMRPFEDVYDIDVLIIAILHNKLKINIEAHLTVQSQQLNKVSHITGCHRMCLQSIANECLYDPPRDPTSLTVLGARFSLCAGNSSWVPMRMLVNVECLVCSEDATLVYWSSGSRGLVTGVLEPRTGDMKTSLLQEAPTPESGLFAHKRGKPIPIAVGHTTALDMVYATQQLWVGTENGLMGSVYVFNLPDMRLHHHLHLQDAVLSMCALNGCGIYYGGDEMKYRVLLGLANGTIILFFGINRGKVVPNPLQGPKLQTVTTGRKPCLNMCPTSNGYIWCSCGDSLELLDIVSLKSLRRLDALVVATGGSETPRGLRRGEVIMLMATNALGVWTVTRRSTLLRLWDAVTGAMKASYNVRNVLEGEDHDITALVTHGGALWLGTRTGYILLLDPSALVDGQNPLLGLQYCGEGKLKFIRPLVSLNKPTARLEVVCSVEYDDEVSGALLAWEFHPLQQWRSKDHHIKSGSLPTSPVSSLPPGQNHVQLSMSA